MIKYHLSDKSNVESIKENGIHPSSDGYVYLFDDYNVTDLLGRKYSVADSIALNQCFLDEYAVFMLDVDESKLSSDDVSEFAAKFQYRHKGMIFPHQIRAIQNRRVNKKSLQLKNK